MAFGARPFPSRTAREGKGGAGGDPEPGDPVERARQICLNQLDHAPRTRAQLADRLRSKGVADEVAEQVLGRFTEVGLIDDAAFARLWVTSRHRGKGLARRALSQELRRKGVADEQVAEAVATLDPEVELATARALVDRRLRTTAGLATDARVRRLAGMLARKGYSAGVAFGVVKQALADEGRDELMAMDDAMSPDDEPAG